MGKRARRRQREKGNTAMAPGNFGRAMERTFAVMGEIQSGVDLAQIVADRRKQLRELIADYDAVHLLGYLLFSESLIDPNSYVESEYPGHAYVAEMVAAEVLLRRDRTATAEVEPVMDARLTREVRRLTQEAVTAESIRRHGNAQGLTDAERNARGRAAMHYLMIRNEGWTWQEESTLRGLFGPAPIAIKLKEQLGFDVDDALRCCNALSEWTTTRLKKHVTDALATVTDFSDDHPAYVWASKRVKVREGREQDEKRTLVFMWACQHVGNALLISAEELASQAAVKASAARSFLASLSQLIDQEDSGWFTMSENMRWRPIVQFDSDKFLLTMPGNDLWALRSILDDALSSDDAYLRHRAKWVEMRAEEMLGSALQPDESHRSIEYRFVDNDGVTVEGEIDGLVRIDDVVLTVEAKSAKVRPGAQRGGEGLIDFLKKNLTKAADQAANAREALREPGRLFKDGQPFSLDAEVREVHPVVVTLSDLSAVAPVLWEFAGTKVMPDGVTIPWVVTLHDLDAVCQTVEWPPQLIHFLRRRSRLNDHGMLAASDELDWWMHYLQFGLYFENDDHEMRQFFLSLTDPLDAWMLYRHGPRTDPAPMPRQSLPSGTRDFLDKLSTVQPQGWIAAACTLLEAGSKTQNKLWKDIARLRRRAQKRNVIQRFTMQFVDGVEPMLLLGVVVPESQSERLDDAMDHLVDQRVAELGMQRALAFGCLATSDQPFDALSILERRKYVPPAALVASDTGDSDH